MLHRDVKDTISELKSELEQTPRKPAFWNESSNRPEKE